jgi:hypothetical protein
MQNLCCIEAKQRLVHGDASFHQNIILFTNYIIVGFVPRSRVLFCYYNNILRRPLKTTLVQEG